jgi:hypothetical protein
VSTAVAYRALDPASYPSFERYAGCPVASPDDLKAGVVLSERRERRVLVVAFEPRAGTSLDAVELGAWCIARSASADLGDAPIRLVESGVARAGWSTTDADGRSRVVKAGAWRLAFELGAERWSQYVAGLYSPQAALREYLELASDRLAEPSSTTSRKDLHMVKKAKRHELEVELARARAQLGGGPSAPWASRPAAGAKAPPMTLDQALAAMRRGAVAAAKDGNAAKAAGLRHEIAVLKLARLNRSGAHSAFGPNIVELFSSGLSTLPDDPAIKGI